MNRPAGVVLLCGAAVLAVWWAAAAPPRAQSAAPSSPRVASPPVADLADEIETRTDQLRDYSRVAPAPRASSRNPFRFGRTLVDPMPVRRIPREVTPPGPPAPPPPPPLRLVGVAERQAPDRIERIAIIAGLGQLFMVKAGESVTSRYDVVAVGADAVELRDTGTGETLRLGLR